MNDFTLLDHCEVLCGTGCVTLMNDHFKTYYSFESKTGDISLRN
jgi:hypothetical protein